MSITPRRQRPMSLEISWVRPPILPRTDSRSVRWEVARGSIEYSAVTQPSPESLAPARHGVGERGGAHHARVAAFNEHGSFRNVGECAGDAHGSQLVVCTAVCSGNSHGNPLVVLSHHRPEGNIGRMRTNVFNRHLPPPAAGAPLLQATPTLHGSLPYGLRLRDLFPYVPPVPLTGHQMPYGLRLRAKIPLTG